MEGWQTSIVNRPELHRHLDQSMDEIEMVEVEEFVGREGLGWASRELTHILGDGRPEVQSCSCFRGCHVLSSPPSPVDATSAPRAWD